MADAVGDGDVLPDAPGILAVVFELVVENVRGDIERGLRERAVLTEEKIRVRLFKREGASAPSGSCSCTHRISIEECHRSWCVLRVERVRTIVAAGKLVFVLIVMVVDGAKLERVRTKDFRHIAVSGVIDVVIAVRAEVGDSCTARRRAESNSWDAAQKIRERKRAAKRGLDVRRLRKILGADYAAENGAVGITVAGLDQ